MTHTFLPGAKKLPTEQSNAIISDCQNYRYWLSRRWDTRDPQVFVMLNPSTADATINDRTISRCIHFAKACGAGGLIVVNLFAFRATNPKELQTADDPIGQQNQYHLDRAITQSLIAERSIICGWGSNKFAAPEAEKFIERANDLYVPLDCLAVNKDGMPKHPLYVSGATHLTRYRQWE